MFVCIVLPVEVNKVVHQRASVVLIVKQNLIGIGCVRLRIREFQCYENAYSALLGEFVGVKWETCKTFVVLSMDAITGDWHPVNQTA